MGQAYVQFPEMYDRRKLNALYREIPLKDNTFRMLRKYFNAMANLYGVIPLGKAWEIIHSQCPRMVTEGEFLAFAEIARHECEYYCILGDDEIYGNKKPTELLRREIIGVGLFGENMDLYILTKESQQGKPYYIPQRQELLNYASPLYWEVTPEAEKLAQFCARKLKMSELEIRALFMEINDKIRYMDEDIHAWLLDWEEHHVFFQNEKQYDEFLRLYQDTFNNGRMHCNRGHTPQELADICAPEDAIPRKLTLGPNIRKEIANGTINAMEFCTQILDMDLPSEELRGDLLRQIAEIQAENRTTPISRNALCPCGSGKKYKRCCGKNDKHR